MIYQKRLIAAAALSLAGFGTANADLPGKHPYFLHALSDLRAARWLVEHRPGDAKVSGHEDVAVQQIDGAIGDIKQAAIDDGKDLHDHPAVDAPNDPAGRLHRAVDILKKVHSDVGREEDDPTSKALKHKSLEHVDSALQQVQFAIIDVEKGR